MNKLFKNSFISRFGQLNQVFRTQTRQTLVDSKSKVCNVRATCSIRQGTATEARFSTKSRQRTHPLELTTRVQCLPIFKRIAPGCISYHLFSSSTEGDLDQLTFETIVEETLDNLLDFFEQMGDEEDVSTDYDVTYSSGVLTVSFGSNHGTYVINKQSPNKQLWLSSPTSGPKRYDFVANDWVYSHDGVSMFSLLSEEISKIVGKELDLRGLIRTKDT